MPMSTSSGAAGAMPQLVDSHCHLDRVDLGAFGDGSGTSVAMGAVLAEAREHGVSHLLCVNIDIERFEVVRGLARDYPGVSASVGVHPGTTEGEDPTVDALLALADDPLVVAIGETGLDYHYNKGDLEWQRQRFRRHIAASRDCGKPLIIHTREAQADTLAIMTAEGARDAGGVMHCFTEDWEMAQAALDLGFYVSMSGIVTFRNAKQVQEVAAKVPLDRLLIETDSPYLAPVPRRGKSNRPAWVRYVAEFVAELRGIPVEELAAATTDNFFRLFPVDRGRAIAE